MFDRCKLSVIHEIYTDFTLLLPEFVCWVYQYTTMVNLSGEHAPEGNIIMRRYKDISKIFQKDRNINSSTWRKLALQRPS